MFTEFFTDKLSYGYDGTNSIFNFTAQAITINLYSFFQDHYCT